MRIIAGSLRGRRLAAPPGMGTRPITDRIKETLFNILGARFGVPGALPEIEVLDLFAGSGGLGIEAISRGARSCLFVEHNRRALRILRQNLADLNLKNICRVSAENAWTMRIPQLSGSGYGLIFADPPYREADDPLPVIDLLERLTPHLTPTGIICFRHTAQTRLPMHMLRALECVDERKLGTMRLWLFSPASAE